MTWGIVEKRRGFKVARNWQECHKKGTMMIREGVKWAAEKAIIITEKIRARIRGIKYDKN